MTVFLRSVWVGSRRRRTGPHSVEERWALQDVSVKIEAGERVAVVGPNGSGKTTLLRTVSQIYPPERGWVHVDGPVAAVVDLTPGIERDLSGYEVLPVRAALMGMSSAELGRRRETILDFAGIEPEILAMPLLRWSAGTLLRLDFSLAACVRPAVLAVDEVLAAADLAFRQRATALMEELSAAGSIVVLATHDIDFAIEFADRAIMLDEGRVVMDADPGAVRERLRAFEHRGIERESHRQWEPTVAEGGRPKSL